MRVLKRFLIVGMVAVLGLTGCSSKEPERIDRKTEAEADKAEKKKADKKEEKEEEQEKEEKSEDKKNKSKAKGTPVTSLTIDTTTVYLENITLRELVIFLQKGGYSYDGLDNKIDPNAERNIEIKNKSGREVLRVDIYNPSNEEDIYSNCKIRAINMRENMSNIYFLNGKINTESKSKEIRKAFDNLGIEYEEDYLIAMTTAANGSIPTTAEMGEEEMPYRGITELPTGQEVSIVIRGNVNEWRTVRIELPVIYE